MYVNLTLPQIYTSTKHFISNQSPRTLAAITFLVSSLLIAPMLVGIYELLRTKHVQNLHMKDDGARFYHIFSLGVKELTTLYWTSNIETMPGSEACHINFTKLPIRHLTLLASRQDIVQRFSSAEIAYFLNHPSIDKRVLIGLLSDWQAASYFLTLSHDQAEDFISRIEHNRLPSLLYVLPQTTDRRRFFSLLKNQAGIDFVVRNSSAFKEDIVDLFSDEQVADCLFRDTFDQASISIYINKLESKRLPAVFNRLKELREKEKFLILLPKQTIIDQFFDNPLIHQGTLFAALRDEKLCVCLLRLPPDQGKVHINKIDNEQVLSLFMHCGNEDRRKLFSLLTDRRTINSIIRHPSISKMSFIDLLSDQQILENIAQITYQPQRILEKIKHRLPSIFNQLKEPKDKATFLGYLDNLTLIEYFFGNPLVNQQDLINGLSLEQIRGCICRIPKDQAEKLVSETKDEHLPAFFKTLITDEDRGIFVTLITDEARLVKFLRSPEIDLDDLVGNLSKEQLAHYVVRLPQDLAEKMVKCIKGEWLPFIFKNLPQPRDKKAFFSLLRGQDRINYVFNSPDIDKGPLVGMLTDQQAADFLLQLPKNRAQELAGHLHPERLSPLFNFIRIPADKRVFFSLLSDQQRYTLLSMEDLPANLFEILEQQQVIDSFLSPETHKLFSRENLKGMFNEFFSNNFQDGTALVRQFDSNMIRLFPMLDASNFSRLFYYFRQDHRTPWIEIFRGDVEFIKRLTPHHLTEILQDPQLGLTRFSIINNLSNQQLNNDEEVFTLSLSYLAAYYSPTVRSRVDISSIRRKVKKVADRLSCTPIPILKKAISLCGLDPVAFFFLSKEHIRSLDMKRIVFTEIQIQKEALTSERLAPQNWLRAMAPLLEIFPDRAQFLTIPQVAQLNLRASDFLRENHQYSKLFAPQLNSSDSLIASVRFSQWSHSFNPALDTELEQFRAALETLQPSSNRWEDVRTKYKQSSMKYHPDKTKQITDNQEREKATELFRQIRTAYEFLEKQRAAERYSDLLDRLNLENATNLQS